MNTKKIDEAFALAERWAERVTNADPGPRQVPADFVFSKDEMFQLRAAFEQIAALITAAGRSPAWALPTWRSKDGWKATGAERRDLERRIVSKPGEIIAVQFQLVLVTRLSTLYATPDQARGLLVSEFLVGADHQLKPRDVKVDLAEFCESSRLRPFCVPTVAPHVYVQLTIENPTDERRELMIRFDGEEAIR